MAPTYGNPDSNQTPGTLIQPDDRTGVENSEAAPGEKPGEQQPPLEVPAEEHVPENKPEKSKH